MAEAQGVSSIGGYDEEFVNTVDDDLQCSICYLPLKDPMQTKCGHRCCTKCLDEHFKRLELNSEPLICPVDRNFLVREKDIFLDKATERKILSLLIKCPSKGCQWTGELRSKSVHLSSCPLKIVSCTNENCSETMTRNNLQNHATNMCPWRILRCTHCSSSHPECKTETHQARCKKFPLNCSQSCGALIPREEVPYHIENECPLTEVPCPLNWMGCTSKIQREVLQGDTRHHLHLNCCMLRDNQDEVRKLQTEVRELREEENDHHNVIDERLRACQNQFEERVNMLTDVNNKLRRDLNEARIALFFFVSVIIAIFAGMSNQERAAFSRLETKMKRSVEEQSKLEMKVMELDKAYKHLEDSIQLVQSMTVYHLEEQCNSSFKWKIRSFSEVLRKAKNAETTLYLNRSPFYTCGYKFKLRLTPDGEGDGQNTHLSLFIIIMKGEYDAILTWPFQKMVTFTLFDQQENANDRNNIVMTFEANPKLESFARPVTDDNIGRGFP